MPSANVSQAYSFSNRPQSPQERYWADTIATRSGALTAMDKLLFRRMLYLDRPTKRRAGGCFASVAALAEMLGSSIRTVKASRARLRRFGLVDPERDAGGSASRWFPSIPHGVSLQPGSFKGDAMDQWLRRQTQAFDIAVGKIAHAERVRRRTTRVQHHALVGATSRPAEGNIAPSEVQHRAPGGATSRPASATRTGPKKRRGKGIRGGGEALVVEVVSDGVSHEVTDGVSHFRKLPLAGAPCGRAAVFSEATAGIPRNGDTQPSDEPGEIQGWFEFRDALITVNGGHPTWFKEGAEKVAYCAKRRRGISHRELLRDAGRGLLHEPPTYDDAF